MYICTTLYLDEVITCPGQLTGSIWLVEELSDRIIWFYTRLRVDMIVQSSLEDSSALCIYKPKLIGRTMIFRVSFHLPFTNLVA